MKEFLLNILPRIKVFSEELDIAERIIDHPWVWINEGAANQKLIFRRGGDLLMIDSGNVQVGSWEIIKSLNSILIDRKSDKILMNYAFANEFVMLLRKDSTDEIVPFVNEAKLPNLDFTNYLKTLENTRINPEPSPRQELQAQPVDDKPALTHFKVSIPLEGYPEKYRMTVFAYLKLRDKDIFSDQLLQMVEYQKTPLFTSTNIHLPDGIYKIPRDVYSRIPEQRRYYDYYYLIRNGIIHKKYMTFLTHKINSEDVYVLHDSNLEGGMVLRKDSFQPIADGRWKFEFMCYLITTNGVIIQESIWP